MPFKTWLQNIVKDYGIDLAEWDIELVETPRPVNFPSHLSWSGHSIIATNPNNEFAEITVNNVWVNGDVVIQHGSITLS